MKKPYTLTTLSNGLRIITVPMLANPTTTVLVLVEAGSKYETRQNNGISHFLEHMCFRGTELRTGASSISLELDSIGAQYNAFTGQEYTGYYAKGKSTQVTHLLEIVADVYLYSTLPQSEIEKEKGVICDEINMYEDTPARKVFDVFMGLVYGDQPAGYAITGSKEKVNTFTRKDFTLYRQAHYVADTTTVIVSGNIDEKLVKKQVQTLFKDISTKPAKKKQKVKDTQKAFAIHIEHKKTDQTHILFGVRAFDTHKREAIIATVLAGVLGAGMSSRLFRKVRDEMGVGYYVGSYNEVFTDHGLLMCNAGVTPGRAHEVLEAMLHECKMLTETLVPKDELAKVKEILASGISMGLESSEAIGQFYGTAAVLRKELRTPEQIEAEIRSVTSEEIMEVAKKIFTTPRLNVAVIGPHTDTLLFKKVVEKVFI